MYAKELNNNLGDRIDNIIKLRQPLAQEILNVENQLGVLLSETKTLDKYCLQLLKQEVHEVEVKEELRKLNLAQLLQRVEVEKNKLTTLRERFSRSTLNVGVVGLMGQGKSTLLKSLSGLSDREIPALPGGACTAVRSTIYHHDGDTYAEVIIHSEDSFLGDVIIPYYETLFPELTPPVNLDDFANNPLPSAAGKDATRGSIYDHLKEYRDNLHQYRQLLQADAPRHIKIKQQEIPEYVAQKRNAQQELIAFSHLAVKEVKIYCRFNQPEVKQIALVDVPGLGDNRLGDEKLMLETLGREVDVVLFVRKPEWDRYSWSETRDTNLYDTAAQALNDLPERAFMVLNQRSSENLAACQLLQETIHQSRIKVVQCEIADCSNPEQAKRVLDLVLEHLAKNITDLDRHYARACKDEIVKLHDEIEVELEKARRALPGYGDDEAYRLFHQLFEKFLQELSDGLAKLLAKLKQQREAIAIPFQAEVEQALATCRFYKRVPAEDQIEKLRNHPKSKGTYVNVYNLYTVELRAYLAQQFLPLDKGLKQSIEAIKSQVTDVLTSSFSTGSLGQLTEVRGAEFLQVMADNLGERRNKLELGFRTIAEFNISYSSLLQRLIRQNLNEHLSPDTSASDNSELSNAQAVQSSLELLYDRAVNQCEETLERWLNVPNQIGYFMVEEFVDQVLYAEGMEGEWRIFLEKLEVRSQIWREFREQECRKQIKEKWKNLIALVATAATELRALPFLHDQKISLTAVTEIYTPSLLSDKQIAGRE